MDPAQALCWDKSRVAHQLTRMEKRELVARVGGGAGKRRIGIELTPEGRKLAEQGIAMHAGNVQRYFFDTLSADQIDAIRRWSDAIVERLEPADREAADRD